MQQRLTELGYHVGSSDGHFGPLTGRALLAFQSENDLEADAIAGQQTLAALEKAQKPETAQRIETTAAELRAKGSSTIKNADTVKTVAAAATAVGALKGSVETGAMSWMENITQSITQVKGVVTPFIDAVSWVTSSLWVTLIAGGLLAWLYASRIIKTASLITAPANISGDNPMTTLLSLWGSRALSWALGPGLRVLMIGSAALIAIIWFRASIGSGIEARFEATRRLKRLPASCALKPPGTVQSKMSWNRPARATAERLSEPICWLPRRSTALRPYLSRSRKAALANCRQI